MESIDIFPDGSCSNNGRPNAIGGWAFIVTLPKTTDIIAESFGKLREGKQTNNRAELEATYQALLWIDSQEKKNVIYTLWCDSEVVVKGITGESGRNANRDIWEGIEVLCDKLIKEKKLNQNSFQTVEAHKSDSEHYRHKNNCYADRLAKQGANSLLIEPVEI